MSFLASPLSHLPLRLSFLHSSKNTLSGPPPRTGPTRRTSWLWCSPGARRKIPWPPRPRPQRFRWVREKEGASESWFLSAAMVLLDWLCPVAIWPFCALCPLGELSSPSVRLALVIKSSRVLKKGPIRRSKSQREPYQWAQEGKSGNFFGSIFFFAALKTPAAATGPSTWTPPLFRLAPSSRIHTHAHTQK